MASAVDSRLAYARLSAVATASRLPTANRGSNNSYTTSWDTTSQTIDPASQEALVDAWNRYSVLVCRDQNLTPEQFIAFSRYFGGLPGRGSQCPIVAG